MELENRMTDEPSKTQKFWDYLSTACLFIIVLAPYGVMFIQKRKIDEIERQLVLTRQEVGAIWMKMSSDKRLR